MWTSPSNEPCASVTTGARVTTGQTPTSGGMLLEKPITGTSGTCGTSGTYNKPKQNCTENNVTINSNGKASEIVHGPIPLP